MNIKIATQQATGEEEALVTLLQTAQFTCQHYCWCKRFSSGLLKLSCLRQITFQQQTYNKKSA